MSLDNFPIATVLALIICLAGAIAVLSGDLTYKEYFESMAVLIGLLGIGRGAAAVRRRA